MKKSSRDELAATIARRVGAKKGSARYARIQDGLDEYFKDRCASIWHTDDIAAEAEEMNVELSDDEKREILYLTEAKMDAGVGINWQTIRHWIQDYVKRREERLAV